MGAIPFWGDGPLGFDFSPVAMQGAQQLPDGTTVAAGVYPVNPWDYVLIAGKPLPGVSVARATGKLKIDKKNPPGAAGTTNTTHGAIAAEGVQLKWTIWTPAQWDLAQSFIQSIIWPNVKKTKNDPVSIFYPGIAILGINAVIFESIESPIPERGGKGTVTVKCQQYLPASKKTKINTAQKVNFDDIPQVGVPPSGQPQLPVQLPGVNYTPGNASAGPPSGDPATTGP